MLKKIWIAVRNILEPIAKTVSNIVNFILLSIVYFVGIGIVSISMKLSGKHFLELRQNKRSNWHEHKVTKEPLKNYYRTF